MKNLKEIKSGIIIGISFLATVLLGGIIYAAVGNSWTNPDDILASSGAKLSSDSWNKMLANMNSLSGSMNNIGGFALPKILYKDSTWVYGDHSWASPSWFGFNSRGNGETATGKIQIGYYILGNKIYIPYAGGNTNITFKIIDQSNNNILYSFVGPQTDGLLIKNLDTSANVGKKVYVEVEDSNTSSSWGWGGIGYDIIIE